MARVRALSYARTGLELVDRALDRIVDALRPVLANPRIDATTVRDVEFTIATAKVIEHRLGRPYAGWSVVRLRTAGATFYETAQTPTDLDKTQVTLVPSATCTADVEVW
jgi:hypothetical protein